MRFFLALVLLCLSACQKPAVQGPEEIFIAKVQGHKIQESDILEELRRFQPQYTGPEEEILRVCLDRLIRTESLFAKARAAGYDRDPQIQAQFKRMVISRFEEVEMQKLEGEGKVATEAVRAHYESNLTNFTSAEKVRVAVMYLRTPSKAGPEQINHVRDRMESMRADAMESATNSLDFGLLAQENSDDQSTRYRGGDCGFVTRTSHNVRWDSTVRDAAFSLKQPGEISPVVKGSDGFYLLKLMERRSPETAPLSAVAARIERQLNEQRRREVRSRFDSELRSGLSIEVNEKALQAIKLPKIFPKGDPSQPPQGPTQ